MKTLKFAEKLVPSVLNGTKTATWRLFDDKNLSVGDELDLVHATTREHFAYAVITSVKELAIQDITDADRVGHESMGDVDEICAIYEGYYHQHISPESRMKIVRFELVKS
ncbi:MAG: ASCH domain-containing protein [bacterium]